MMRIRGAVPVNEYGNVMTDLMEQQGSESSVVKALTGSAIIGFWYWCTDQYIAQRCLERTRRSRAGEPFWRLSEAAAGISFLIPGMIACYSSEVDRCRGAGFLPFADGTITPTGFPQCRAGGTGRLCTSRRLTSPSSSLFNSLFSLFTMTFTNGLSRRPRKEAGGDRSIATQ